MPIRPTQTRWFETYIPHSLAMQGIALLAKTGKVELERSRHQVDSADAGRLRYFVNRFQALAGAHAHDLPNAGTQASTLTGDPIRLANQALHSLRDWCAQVDAHHLRLDQLDAALHHLEQLQDCIEGMARQGIDLEHVFIHSGFLCKSLLACPVAGHTFDTAQDNIELAIQGRRWNFLYVAGLTGHCQATINLAVVEGCEQLNIPAWLSQDSAPKAPKQQILDLHLKEVRHERMERRAALNVLRNNTEVAQALANINTLRWYLDSAADVLDQEAMTHVCGWTTASGATELQQVLTKAGIHAIIRFPKPPSGAKLPVVGMQNWWAQPFRPMVELLGPPGRHEVDPSGLLAFVVPLLFGFMFPDVGHGLVLALLAWLLGQRWPQVRLLIPCGLSAAVFGVLVGEVFGLHHVIPALWSHSLAHPLTVLAASLGLGATLILVSMVFSGMQARWRGQGLRWLATDGSLLLLYLATLVSFAFPWTGWLVLLAGVQYLLAGVWLAPQGQRVAVLPSVLGNLLLGVFELGINTLSFLRVGAFALAHAALSQAVVTLADSTGCIWGWWLVMVLGNLFTLIMEGMLAMVQTTRLILFEFFIRFMRGEGRVFKPILPPPAVTAGQQTGQHTP